MDFVTKFVTMLQSLQPCATFQETVLWSWNFRNEQTVGQKLMPSHLPGGRFAV